MQSSYLRMGGAKGWDAKRVKVNGKVVAPVQDGRELRDKFAIPLVSG